MTRTLVLVGGWGGHSPKEVSAWARSELLDGHEVLVTDDLDALEPDTLALTDLVVPVWTFGSMTDGQEDALVDAVADGVGLLAWHGHASAFLGRRRHKHLLGGQFVDHPGGDAITYTVRFGDHDLTSGLDDLVVTSEQYHLLVDPAVTVLASTEMVEGSPAAPPGTTMPVAWCRPWGRGRVFDSALGHDVPTISHPAHVELLRRAVRWCRRRSAAPA